MTEDRFPTTGWSSSDLGRAYFAVERARAEAAQPNGSSIDDAFRVALKAIEAADCELEKVR